MKRVELTYLLAALFAASTTAFAEESLANLPPWVSNVIPDIVYPPQSPPVKVWITTEYATNVTVTTNAKGCEWWGRYLSNPFVVPAMDHPWHRDCGHYLPPTEKTTTTTVTERRIVHVRGTVDGQDIKLDYTLSERTLYRLIEEEVLQSTWIKKPARVLAPEPPWNGFATNSMILPDSIMVYTNRPNWTIPLISTNTGKEAK